MMPSARWPPVVTNHYTTSSLLSATAAHLICFYPSFSEYRYTYLYNWLASLMRSLFIRPTWHSHADSCCECWPPDRQLLSLWELHSHVTQTRLVQLGSEGSNGGNMCCAPPTASSPAHRDRWLLFAREGGRITVAKCAQRSNLAGINWGFREKPIYILCLIMYAFLS